MTRDRRPHIGIYGRRNNGKSTLINRLAGQEIAIVSQIPGTTTDLVKKSFEIIGFGPVILIDTAGIDDAGELGLKRVDKSLTSIKIIDLAILVIKNNELGSHEQDLINMFHQADIPFIVVHNKEDIAAHTPKTCKLYKELGAADVLPFCSSADPNIVIEAIRQAIPEASYKNPSLVGDIISSGDIVMLITPIDIEAPEGRMILPQVQAIRDVLDNNASCIVLKENEVDSFLQKTGIRPNLVITDSQAFQKVNASIPVDIPLTSFSILLAHFKGDFNHYLAGTPHINDLKDGDRVLVLESCSHNVSCEDIGRFKIPRWISSFTGKQLEFEVVAGLNNVPRPINDYALVIQCGGCMITRKQLINRLKPAVDAGIPVTNYGLAIAYTLGIFNRAIAPFLK